MFSTIPSCVFRGLKNLLSLIFFILSSCTSSALALLLNDTLILPASTTQTVRLPPQDDELRVAFGSCYGMLNFSTDIFRSVQMYKPHMWLWLGDAAYTDNIMEACKLFLIKDLNR